jgi:hypothetical protein
MMPVPVTVDGPGKGRRRRSPEPRDDHPTLLLALAVLGGVLLVVACLLLARGLA